MNRTLYWVLLLSLLPGLIAQGLWLRRRAPRFAPAGGATQGQFGGGYADALMRDSRRVGGRAGAIPAPAPPLRVLGLGDSIIAGVGVAHMQQSLIACFARELAQTGRVVDWVCLGRSGADSGEIVSELLPQLPAQSFDVIVLSLGVNDVSGFTPSRRWRQRLRVLLSTLRAHSPRARILFLGLPPLASFPLLPQPLRGVLALRARVLDSQARRLVTALPGVVHVAHRARLPPGDFAADGYHPAAHAYARWAWLLAAAVLQKSEAKNLIARAPDYREAGCRYLNTQEQSRETVTVITRPAAGGRVLDDGEPAP